MEPWPVYYTVLATRQSVPAQWWYDGYENLPGWGHGGDAVSRAL